MIRHTQRYNKGFTIIELIIVVVVIAILATIVIVAYTGVQSSARDKSLLSDIDALDGLETDCGLNKAACGITTTAAKAWYSGSGVDSYLKFTPSPGNVIDVVVDATRYCIRGYNPAGTKNSIANAATKESAVGACTALAASVAAGGTGENSLVGWWKFNGNANDSSGNANDGVVNGATLTANMSSQANSAYSFNGSSNFIKILTTGFPTTTTAITLSFWANPNTVSVGGNSVIAANPDGAYNRLNIHLPNGPDSKIYWDFGNITTTGRLSIAFSPSWFNTWAYWTFTADPTAGMKIYRNGTSIATSATASSFATGTQTLSFGQISTDYWNGTLDDFRIYSRALSGSEITALYSAGAQ